MIKNLLYWIFAIIIIQTLCCNTYASANESALSYVCDDVIGNNSVSVYISKLHCKSYFGMVPKGNTEWKCEVVMYYHSGDMKNRGAEYCWMGFDYRLSETPNVAFIDFKIPYTSYFDKNDKKIGGFNKTTTWMPVRIDSLPDKIFDAMMEVLTGKR